MEQKLSKTLEELKEVAINSNKEKNIDLFYVDPRLIVVEHGHNVRDFETEKVQNHIHELMDNIRENGIMTPIECRRGEKVGVFVDDKGKQHDLWSWIVIDGECRKRAVDMLIEEGIDYKLVPVIQEKKGSNDANRVLDMLNANIGLRFTPIELAQAYKRFINWNWTPQEIALKVGKTVQHVNECLDLLDFNDVVKKGLFEGKITANNVRQISKKLKDTDPTQRQKLIEKRLVSAINRAKEVGEKEKAGKYLDMSVEDTDKSEQQITPTKRTAKKDSISKFIIEGNNIINYFDNQLLDINNLPSNIDEIKKIRNWIFDVVHWLDKMT